jgi:GH18 family chitinase
VPYLRKDDGTGVISYDDAESIPLKIDLAVWERGLAGGFIWEISQDFSPSGQPLLDAFHAALVR